MKQVETAKLTGQFLLLTGTRWLPAGMLVPVLVLLFTNRGFTLAEFGVVAAIMAIPAFVLEVPTGGLADAAGRRRVLIWAGGFLLAGEAGLLAIAVSNARPAWWIVGLSGVAIGVSRALDSGPLEAWYVDRLHSIDRDADVERGLGRAARILGYAIAAGSLLAGGIIAWDPFDPLDPMTIVIGTSLLLVLVQIVSIVWLMDEDRSKPDITGLAAAFRDVPAVIGETVSLVRTSPILVQLLIVEATWVTGAVAFENLFPVRLKAIMGSAEEAAALLGPVSAAAWIASGTGAGLIVHVSRRLDPYRTGALLRILQASTILGMALLSGRAGLIAAFVATYFIHGSSAPTHYSLLHAQVDADHRTTALSLNSMVAFASFSMAGIAIGAVTGAATVPIAIGVCSGATALGAIGYLYARRHDTARMRQACDQRTHPSGRTFPRGIP